jgi:hypothetical protein
MKGYFLATIVALFGVFALAGTARADGDFHGFQKGDWALTLNGGGVADKDFDNSSFTLTVAPSYFLTNILEVGVRQLGAYNDGFAGATTGFANWNFRLENHKWVPFVGVNFGYSYGEGVSDAWRAGPEAGLKYFVNDTTYLYGNVSYAFDLNDGFDNGGFLYGVGIGFKF